MTDRGDYEAAIASNLSELFASARANLDSGNRIDWDAFQIAAAEELEEQLLAVYVLVFLLMADKGLQNSTLLANSLGQQWASGHSRNLASGLAGNIRGELRGGAEAGRVFSGGRAAVLSATEVTRAITHAETEARRANAAKGLPGKVRVGPTPFDVGDGLTARWITERDSKVCPICNPLHRRRVEAWIERFPFGPPAHPNCRCWLEYS